MTLIMNSLQRVSELIMAVEASDRVQRACARLDVSSHCALCHFIPVQESDCRRGPYVATESQGLLLMPP